MPLELSPLVIEQLEPSAELPLSPRLPPGAPGVEIAIVPATRGGKPTRAVLSTTELTPRQSLLYGPDARQVLRLVVFDPLRGLVFHGDPEGPHAPGIGPVAKFNPPPPPPPPSGAKLPGGFGFNVNKDIRLWVELPKDAARYTVVAWLENLVSKPQLVDLPEGGPEPTAEAFAARRGPVALVPVAPEPHAPAAANGVIALAVAPFEPGAIKDLARVSVTLGPNVLAKDPGAPGISEGYVAVLAQTALDRQVAVRVLRVRIPPIGEPAKFGIELAELFPLKTRQPIFIIVLAGKAVSKPETAMPRDWKE